MNTRVALRKWLRRFTAYGACAYADSSGNANDIYGRKTKSHFGNANPHLNAERTSAT